MAHWECRYCDRPAGYMGIPIKLEGDLICACGAEWEDAKVLVEDEEYESDYLFEDDDENVDWDFGDDRLDCGCCSCCGCSCEN